MFGDVQYADNVGTQIAFQRFGQPGGEPLLLVTGLGSQMVFWPDGFCEQLASRGFDVVRFDNRDTGLSTRFSSAKVVNPWLALVGRAEPPPYTGEAMADDGFAVMDTLGWQSAHLVGLSMGSALVQFMAVRRPERVRSVACISTLVQGNPLKVLTQLKYGTFAKLSRLKFPDTPQGKADQQLAIIRAMAPSDPPFDDSWAREAVAVAVERGIDDAAQSRHLAALKNSSKGLVYSKISSPTVIIQGIDDPLIRLSAAQGVAARIPNARSVSFAHMGHGVPPHLWPDIAATIQDNAARVV
ncbi:MAG: alpha/beta hydrolase [Actinomycetes bacterium]